MVWFQAFVPKSCFSEDILIYSWAFAHIVCSHDFITRAEYETVQKKRRKIKILIVFLL